MESGAHQSARAEEERRVRNENTDVAQNSHRSSSEIEMRKLLRGKSKVTFSSALMKNKIKLGAWNHSGSLFSRMVMVLEEATRHWFHLHLISSHWKSFRYIEELVACVSVQYWRLSKLSNTGRTPNVCDNVSAAEVIYSLMVQRMFGWLFNCCSSSWIRGQKKLYSMIITWLDVLFVQLKETMQGRTLHCFFKGVLLCQRKPHFNHD